MATLTVSEAADRVGLTVHAVRYYERAGLIPPVPRTAAGRRAFDDEALAWLEYAACLRALGMPVALIRRYVAAVASGSSDEAVDEVMSEHVEALRTRRAQLDRYIAMVEWKVAARASARR